MTGTVAVFDGHNDTLLKLERAARAGEALDFAGGALDLDIDLPRARAAGFAGGFFAMFTPSGIDAGDAAPDDGGLRFPVDTVVFNMQEVFVADQGNDRIQVYSLDGTWLRSFTFEGTDGQGCNWFTNICEVPGAPAFGRLKAMDLDALGRLHVVDNLWGVVLVFDTATGDFEGQYGEYGHDVGQLSLPMDVLAMQSGQGLVTSGDGDRIEIYAAP